MATESYFRRGLSPDFLNALAAGHLRPVIDAALAHGLDLGVRENYLNLYRGRSSVLKLAHKPKRDEFEASVHFKYLPEKATSQGRGNYPSQRFASSAAAEWAARFRSQLSDRLDRVREYDKPEGAMEFALSVAHRGAPLTIIDRQVQLGSKRDSRVDAIAVLQEPAMEAPTLVMLELKAGAHLSVAEVTVQVDRYRKYFVAPTGTLRGDVAACLARVWEQKAKLGFLTAPIVGPALHTLAVEFLVVLASDTEGALPRGHHPGRGGLIRFAGTSKLRPRIPPSSAWAVLRGP